MQPGRLLSASSGERSSLGKHTSGNLEKGLSGTYDVPSSAAIAEKVHELSLRRKKPAWATTQASNAEEASILPAAESVPRQHADAPSTSDAPRPDVSSAPTQQPATVPNPAAAAVMLQAFHAAPAAFGEADDHFSHNGKQDQHDAGLIDMTETTHAAVAALEPVAEGSEQPQGRAVGSSPADGALSNSPDAQVPATSHAAKAQQHVHGQDEVPHYLSLNKVTLARVSSVARDQTAIQMSKARQASIEKHVAQHDMFKGSSSELGSTAHRSDAKSESFQGATLAAILRESAVADDVARRQAQKAARAADDALPLFVTTSASLQSTSRQHSRPNSRPASAAATMTRSGLLSHGISHDLGVHPDALRSALHASSPLSSPRTHAQTLREGARPSSSLSNTGRIGSMANKARTEGLHTEWRSAASDYAAQVLHPERSMPSEHFEQHRLHDQSETLHMPAFDSPLDKDEGADAAAALFAEDLPAGIIDPSRAAPPASLSPARLDRFDSLTKGKASDGIRHSSRRMLQPSDSFSPRVDAHSRKLAEAIYEQTRGLGPTALQGRLNYLHQLGKITIRDRQVSLEKLPQQREDIEFALCTFQPKLNKRPLTEEWAGSVIERSEAWQQRREQKVREAREQDADKDLLGCTFWPDVSASAQSLHSTQEVAAMTRSLPEQQVLRYLAQGQSVPATEASSITHLTSRTMHTSSLHELPAELSTYISQMKYYERMHKVKEREQHIQEVLSKFDGSKWVYQVTKPCAPKLGQPAKEFIPSLAPPVRLMPGMLAAQHALRAEY